jgi:hypothetical protein
MSKTIRNDLVRGGKGGRSILKIARELFDDEAINFITEIRNVHAQAHDMCHEFAERQVCNLVSHVTHNIFFCQLKAFFILFVLFFFRSFFCIANDFVNSAVKFLKYTNLLQKTFKQREKILFASFSAVLKSGPYGILCRGCVEALRRIRH